MTHAFKRFVGILLTVVMVFSLCTVAFAEEPAEITHNSLGVTAGDNINLFDDPTGTGEKVFKLYAANNRPNFELADLTDNTKPFEPVAGTNYTIKFDYYLEANTNTLEFTLYYGAQTKYSETTDKKAISSSKSGFSIDNAGDGKWHTAAMSFNASTTKGKINGVADQVLPYIYLTYYAPTGKTINGYLKNIEIIEEDGYLAYSTNTYKLDKYFDADGNQKENYTYNSNNADHAMTTSTLSKNEAGEVVITPSSDTFTATTNNRTTITDYEYITLPDASGNAVGHFGGTGAWNGVFNIKYKVVKIGESDFAGIGIGRSSNTQPNTCVYNTVKHTKTTTDEWHYYTAAIQGESNNANKLRITVAGIGSEIVIDSIQVAYVSALNTEVADPANEKETVFTGLNAGITIYNDNGEIQIAAAYDGTDIPFTPNNGYMGEKSAGWCSDSALTNVITTTPVDNTTKPNAGKKAFNVVYAKYDTVVIDTFQQSFAKGWDYNAASATSTIDSVTVKSSGADAMFMVPAYEMTRPAEGSAAYEYYKFTVGQKYNIQLEVSDVVLHSEGTNNGIQLIAATSAGQSGGRDTGNTPNVTTQNFTENTAGPLALNVTLEYNSKFGDAGYAIRNTSDKNVISFTIDKIIITKVTENTNFSLVNIDGELTVVNLGTKLELPAKADTETDMFVGWYRSNTNMGKADSKLFISTSDIALPGVYLADAFESVTLVPKYISKASHSIDFSETDYEGLANGSELGGLSGQHSIVVDDSIDANSDDNTYLYAKSDSSNIFKTSLFSEAGRVIAVEGVTYRFEIRYKVVKALKAGGRIGGYIGICRNPIDAYVPDALDGVGGAASHLVKATSVTDGFVTYTGDITNKYMYKADADDSFLNNQLSIMITDGEVYVDYVKVTPVSFAYTNVDYDTTKGTIDVDYANGTLKVIPADGYKLSTKGVKVQMQYRDYVPSNSITPKSIEAAPAPDVLSLKTTDNVNFTFKTDYADYAKKIGALVITAEFVEETAVDGNIIAASVRFEDANAATYVSAGIRFRGRISAEDVNGAAEVGFVAIPVNAMSNYANISLYMEGDGSAALKGIAYNAAANKNVVYSTIKDANDTVTYYDYQLLIKGLTKDDGSVDLTDLKLNVAMYITDAEGNTTYLPGVYGIAYSDYAN